MAESLFIGVDGFGKVKSLEVKTKDARNLFKLKRTLAFSMMLSGITDEDKSQIDDFLTGAKRMEPSDWMHRVVRLMDRVNFDYTSCLDLGASIASSLCGSE